MKIRDLPINRWVKDYKIYVMEQNGTWGAFTGDFNWTDHMSAKKVAIAHFTNQLKGYPGIVKPGDEFALFKRSRKFTGEYKTVTCAKAKKTYKTKEVLHSDWVFETKLI